MAVPHRVPLMPGLLCSFQMILSGLALAQDEGTLQWYLPDAPTYSASIPTPAGELGWEVGTWHVRHDQLVRWFQVLEDASPRMALEIYGESHEERPLLLAAFSSPENLERLEELRTEHAQAVKSGRPDHDGPLILWMGYSVHGNESSGANAALLLAYHLAASTSKEVETLLEDTVILVDPCLNPDGLSRFAHWANNNRGQVLVDHVLHRERKEAWPGGRTNHYWFDLNRDWLLLTHPESRARLKQFHRWMPTVLTDYHEMGGGSTYFFQPGIPSRQNPLTPEGNLSLTRKLAAFHAGALDRAGSLYYTEESFDDFYYGKGSTYPDINGSIGILFEQASSRGHLQENSYGGISFPFTIRNQLLTSLSTIEGARALKEELTSYQRGFYRSAREAAADDSTRAYIFGAEEDPGRSHDLAQLLRQHDVLVHHLSADRDGYPQRSSFVVPLEQAQYRLIRSVFETRKSWEDNAFYDVSAWTLPFSFDVPFKALGPDDYLPAMLGPLVGPMAAMRAPEPVQRDGVAWLLEWSGQEAAPALTRLLLEGARARVATKPFEAMTPGGRRKFAPGTIVFADGIQDPGLDSEIFGELRTLGDQAHRAVTGLTPSGVDLGSRSLAEVPRPTPALIVGEGVSAYEAGEVWFHLDSNLGLPLPLIDRRSLEGLDLGAITHLLLVSGSTDGLGEAAVERIREWVSGGGVVVATRRASLWAVETLLGGDEEEAEPVADDEDASPPDEDHQYGDYEDLRARHRIAGAIFEAEVDLTHPMCFGLARDRLPVFRNSTDLLPGGDDPFALPARYAEEPLLSGYSSQENVERLAGSACIRADRLGRGTVICMVDNPLFRGVWRGTGRLYTNALFFGAAIKKTGSVSAPKKNGSEHGDHDH